ncbi:MAG: PAS domain S-box protein, partial [Acidobacteriota bacterium]|nr:PAS domain S-box protein [Acidobacteriota bacterium]
MDEITLSSPASTQNESPEHEPIGGAERQALRYRRVFETAKDGIMVLDANTGEVLEVNPRMLELAACSRSEMVGRPIWETDYLKQHDAGRIIFRELKRKETIQLEIDLENKRGKCVAIELLCNIYNEDGIRAIQANVRDVSQRRRDETALRDSEERFRLLVQGVKDYAIFMMDPRGRIVSWNVGAERVLGYSESEILGRDVAVIFTPEDREHGIPEREMGRAAKHGQAGDERWHVRKDGTRFFASGTMTLLQDDGKLRGFAKLMRDDTERRKTEEALRQAHKLESIGVLAGGVAH